MNPEKKAVAPHRWDCGLLFLRTFSIQLAAASPILSRLLCILWYDVTLHTTVDIFLRIW